VLVPKRRRGYEVLDDPGTDPALRERSLNDVRRSNVLLGGRRAVLSELARALPALGSHCSLLDVGTGLADIPHASRELAARRGVTLTTYGVDEAETLARVTTHTLDASACADARALPFGDSSVDVVICSQLLHHFKDKEIPRVLRGFTPAELSGHVQRSTGVRAEVRRHLGFRITAAWEKNG
jgi:hypothetical protein